MRPTVLVATLAHLLPLVASCADETTVPIEPGSPPFMTRDGLWTVSGSAAAILRMDPRPLSDTTLQEPGTVITTTSVRLNSLAAVAFDTTGNLWVIDLEEPVLLEFEREALESSGSKLARTIIVPSSSSLTAPTGLAFDAQQRLWVADRSGTLSRFDVEQLAVGGAQRPAVVLNIPGNPTAIAFDASGSLWVSDNGLDVIRKYTPGQLSTSGYPVPEVVLSASELSLVNPAGLAFDASGNLWVANSGGPTIASFSPDQLSRTGSPAPEVVITPHGGSLSIPVGLAFDGDGSLWVVGGAGALMKFSRVSLGTSGEVVPSLRAQVPGHSLFWSIAFWPVPNGLPLGQRSPQATFSSIN